MTNAIQRIGALLITAMLPVAYGCDGVGDPDLFTPPDSGIEGMSIEPGNIVLEVGESVRLFAETTARYGAVFGAPEPVNWTSSDTRIVRVSENGVVEALRRGDATIIADCGEHDAIAHVQVVGGPKIDPPEDLLRRANR